MQPNGQRSTGISLSLKRPGWLVALVLCVVPVIFWLGYGPISTKFGTPYQNLSSLGQVVGILGLVLYSLNFLYATRLKIIEDWFGGLNRAYIAHHIVGGLALVLLALHPMFMVARYLGTSIKTAAEQVLPNLKINGLENLNTNLGQEWAVFFGSIAFFGLVVLLVLTFFVKLPYQLWLLTHKFLGLFLFFAGLHVLFINGSINANLWLKLYLLGLVAIGMIAYIYKSLFGGLLIRKYSYTVKNIELIGNKKVNSISLSPDSTPISFEPGQFLFIRFIGNNFVKKEWHPFSIASSSGDADLKIGAKSLGDFTASLKNLKRGDQAEIEGAYGKFSYSFRDNPRQIWIAGGIGITPFLSMAKSLKPDHLYKIDLYYSVNDKSELIDIDSLKSAIKTKQGGLRVLPFVASDKKRLNVNLIKSSSSDLLNADIYICGPPAMMKDIKNQLIQFGVKKSNIISEEFALS